MTSSLYRYYPLPNTNYANKLFERDGIAIINNELFKDGLFIKENPTINDILRFETNNIRKDLKKDISDEDIFKYLRTPYKELYQINFILIERKLWISSLTDLNDVFEGSYWENNQLKNQTSNIGVISFCNHYKNQLMWGLYANGNCGICIEFELNIDTDLSEKAHICKFLNDNQAILSQVTYTPTPYIKNPEQNHFYAKQYADLINLHPEAKYFIKSVEEYEHTVIVSRIKNAAWINESEIRISISSHQNILPIDTFVDPKNNNANLLNISKVIFGNKINESENNLYTLIKNTIKSNIKTTSLKIKPNSFEFYIDC